MIAHPPFKTAEDIAGMFRWMDMCSEAGAQYLAEQIRLHWAAFGYEVEVEIERTRFGRNFVYMPRLPDFVGGLPRRTLA